MNGDRESFALQVWQTIQEDIELKIVSGHYSKFDKLPSIVALSNEYKVSKSTIQKALDSMCRQGYLTKKHGIGFYVKPYTLNEIKEKHFRRLLLLYEDLSAYAVRLNLSDGEVIEILEMIEDRLKGVKL